MCQLLGAAADQARDRNDRERRDKENGGVADAGYVLESHRYGHEDQHPVLSPPAGLHRHGLRLPRESQGANVNPATKDLVRAD